jgi:hypothetical protein
MGFPLCTNNDSALWAAALTATVVHCDDFYMLSQQRFNRFTDAQGFIHAASPPSI